MPDVRLGEKVTEAEQVDPPLIEDNPSSTGQKREIGLLGESGMGDSRGGADREGSRVSKRPSKSG
eukprot:12554660-Ditylum_brightwellii.AAC.1